MFIEKKIYTASEIMDVKCRNNVMYRIYFRPSIIKIEQPVVVYIGGKVFGKLFDLTIGDEMEKKSGYTTEELVIDYIRMNGV